jgi:uncharacterized protein (TIGR02145 family)
MRLIAREPITVMKFHLQQPATVETNIVDSITSVSAVSGGTITSDGGGQITVRGVCWNTTGNPTTEDSKTSNGTGSGDFVSIIQGLTAGSTFYIRAYATNSAGTVYGEQRSFITPLADANGNIYPYVTIGTQVWMKENLRTTKYNNGDTIGTTYPLHKMISYVDMPKYQWGSICPSCSIYGRLYTWFAITDDRKVCPQGWHIPTDDEWKTLEIYLGMTRAQADSTGWRGTDQGSQLKSEDIWYYIPSHDIPGTNTSGFSAYPAGYRTDHSFEAGGGFGGFWWTGTVDQSTEWGAWSRTLLSIESTVERTVKAKHDGLSVRCVKD